MCFFDKFIALCTERGVAPTRALIDASLSKSLYKKWGDKPETVPNGATLKKLSVYFGVPVGYFLGESEKPTISEDDELNEYLEMLRTRPECRMLLDTVKGAKKSEVEENVRFIEALRKAKDAN